MAITTYPGCTVVVGLWLKRATAPPSRRGLLAVQTPAPTNMIGGASPCRNTFRFPREPRQPQEPREYEIVRNDGPGTIRYQLERHRARSQRCAGARADAAKQLTIRDARANRRSGRG